VLTNLPMRSVRDQVLLLRSLPAFAPLDDEALALFGEHSRLRPVRAGERLLTLGEPIHHVYVVLSGCIRWQRKDKPENVAGRHQVVGWITAMARDAHGLHAVVSEDGMVLELPTEILERALEQHFSIVRNMLRLGASTLVQRRGLLPVRPERASPVEIGSECGEPKTLVERVIDMRAAPIF
jgi:CRP-like cAMP-binding protein